MERWVKRWEVPKSTGGGYWVVAVDRKGNYGCSCPVWKFRRQECKHIFSVMQNGETGQEVNYRDTVPGNVGEVSIKGDIILYPLVPFPINPDLVATIVFDLLRGGAYPEQVKDYTKRMFRGGVSFKTICEHVKQRGRLIFSEFRKGQGWIKPTYVPMDTPIKVLE